MSLLLSSVVGRRRKIFQVENWPLSYAEQENSDTYFLLFLPLSLNKNCYWSDDGVLSVRPSVHFWKSGKCLEKSTLVNISRMRKNERKIRSMKSGLRERWRRRRRGQSSIINNYWAERERSGNERHNECNNNSLGLDRNRNVTKVADFVVKFFTLIWDDIR